MKLQDFLEAIKKHGEWLNGLPTGVRLEFHGTLEVKAGVVANLRSADLSYANLRSANLRYADLSYANLSYADLSYANLRYANLRSANLRYANLSYADLSYANLSYADLSYANLDFSSGISFQCRSLEFKADIRLAAQLAYHFCRTDFGTCKEAKAAQKALTKLANKSHLLTTHGLPKITAKRTKTASEGV